MASRAMLAAMLEFLALGSDPVAAKAVAQDLGGVAYLADAAVEAGGTQARPFASIVRVATADPSALGAAADIGSYLVYSRAMRRHPPQWSGPHPTPGLVAAFGMVRKQTLTHAQADTHWRDVHGPLALRIHIGMWDYTQCSVVHRFAGPDFDGVALCGFGSQADLRERFFDGPEGRQAIIDDIATFVDTEGSARRVLCQEWHFG